MENKVDIFKALSDSNRLRILSMLSVRDLCVCEINAVLNVSMSTISSHLKILRNAGLVTSKKDGRWIIYSLYKSDDTVNGLVGRSLDFIENEDEVVSDREHLNTITPENCSA